MGCRPGITGQSRWVDHWARGGPDGGRSERRIAVTLVAVTENVYAATEYDDPVETGVRCRPVIPVAGANGAPPLA